MNTDMKTNRTIRTLRPGAKGTLRLQLKYGRALLCVRYVDDLARGKRYKTVELIVDEQPLRAKAPHAPEDIVNVKIAVSENELRHRAKASGGRWNHARQVWEIGRASCRERV